MKKKLTVDGNEACSYTSYFFTEVAGIYPITPSSPMAEHMDEWSSKNRTNIFNDNVKVVEMQSEAGASGFVHGALQSGALTSTFTASQGLLLMIPNMYKIAGEMLPCVMHVAARALSTHALSIFGDHQDIYATRSTGFCMLASSSVQDAAYLSGIAHLSAIESSLPFMHFFDGFRTSHELSKIDVLEKEDWMEFINYDALNKFKSRALNPSNPCTKGVAENDDIYFQATEVRNKFYDAVPDIVNKYMEKLNNKFNTNYEPFNYYGDIDATNIIVAMGSVCETIKETIDYLNKIGKKVGLVEVHLYRPFSIDYLRKVIPNSVENVAVLDRTKEPGSAGEPLYLDVALALKDKNVVGGRYGLSSKNTTPSQIVAVYNMLEKKPKTNFTIGINDDVTNLSLNVKPLEKINNHHELLFYGYGSDGMVSASKSIIKLIGDNTDNYVQGYFQYDSKKSGGVTKCHLRFGDTPIRSTYYSENPSIIVVTKESYLKEFDCISNICENGIFLLNTSLTKEALEKFLPRNVIKEIKNKNIKFYTINAYELASKCGLQNKISMIMETAILSLTNLIDIDKALDELKKYVKDHFFKKGESIINANIDAIDKTNSYLKLIDLENVTENSIELNTPKSVFEAMISRKGNELPTSAFLNNPDGTFEAGTSALEKRGISELVPSWIDENCIECNQCSFVCPHGVIRPFLLSNEEFDKAPDIIKNRAKKALLKPDMYFIMGISVKDCTGCGLCIKTCPGKKNIKALISEKQVNSKEQEIFDYLDKNISSKTNEIKTIKDSQFVKPKFAYSGACAGCGEPAYIKLLTQLFGDHMIISNATGCSSIYGGSAPSMPYTIPWASSLFEDNAEYGFGMLSVDQKMKQRICKVMDEYRNKENSDIFDEWINNYNDYNITNNVVSNLNLDKYPKLKELESYLIARSIWTVGGDGWAYDIGFGGIDHVLSTNENVNILVLDTQVYSNTGGQASKASTKGSIAAFATSGKQTAKKDLARIAMSYPNVYVAQVNLGANMNQLLKAFKEAENYKGPSIVIAYAPCISHGIKGGMTCSLEMEKMATSCGYYPLFRYNPIDEKFTLDSKNVDFDLYEEFLNNQTRFSMLRKINKDHADSLLKENKENAIKRFEYYKSLEK